MASIGVERGNAQALQHLLIWQPFGLMSVFFWGVTDFFLPYTVLTSSPNDENLDLVKMKAFADDKIMWLRICFDNDRKKTLFKKKKKMLINYHHSKKASIWAHIASVRIFEERILFLGSNLHLVDLNSGYVVLRVGFLLTFWYRWNHLTPIIRLTK